MKLLAYCAIASLLAGCTTARQAFDELALQRWGHGAHHWALPESPGGTNHERHKHGR